VVDQAISQAWLEAAKDLGIGITAPFTVQSDEPSSYAAHVIDFGGPKGMVVSSRRSSMTAATQGFYRSNLAPSYRCYERQHFMATLNDWDGFRRRGFDPFGGRANRRIETLLTRAPSRYFCSETP
jgi:hypothetical protein